MATLRRSHAPVPWGAQAETAVWERSQVGAHCRFGGEHLRKGSWQPGTPRRRRSDRPPLTHDPGWDWDGMRILFCEETAVPDRETHDCEACRFQLWEDEDSTLLSGRTPATLSLLDIAWYQATKKRTKGTPNNHTLGSTSQRISNYSES